MKDSTVQSVCGKLANGVPDKTTGNFYRPDYTGFYEGSGRFLSEPAENAAWSLGYASEKLTPAVAMGDVYVSGSDGKKRTLESVPKPQFIRAVAVSDGSGRGAHVFASLDCAGLSNAEVKEIRLSLAASNANRFTAAAAITPARPASGKASGWNIRRKAI